MFRTKERLIATLCIVGFLVASLGMYTEPAHASGHCYLLLQACNTAHDIAADICRQHGNYSGRCLAAQAAAWVVCLAYRLACN